MEIHMKNIGKTEFSIEYFGIHYFMIFIVLVDMVMLIYNGHRMIERN